MTIEDRTELGLLGGEEGVRRLVNCFYDRVEVEPLLQHMFPKEFMPKVRQTQYEFFVQFFGGADLYSQKHGQPWMRFRHQHVTIGQPERDAWMTCIMGALDDVGASAELKAHLDVRLGKIATNIINHHPDRKDAQYFK